MTVSALSILSINNGASQVNLILVFTWYLFCLLMLNSFVSIVKVFVSIDLHNIYKYIVYTDIHLHILYIYTYITTYMYIIYRQIVVYTIG